ncbi:MAG: TIGR01244 family protein [Comamonadaceae bacterium PBBC2]|nr:MAG: TIGR01244 family protein [Comamonadaceae bacterium PBBC2]
MSISTQNIAPGFSVAAQLSVAQIANAAALGFKTVINNRPDGEGGPDQPLSAAIAAAAQAQGLHYVYLPVVSGSITPEQAVAMRTALQAAPQPVLAFCRSGARSAQLHSLAQMAG